MYRDILCIALQAVGSDNTNVFLHWNVDSECFNLKCLSESHSGFCVISINTGKGVFCMNPGGHADETKDESR